MTKTEQNPARAKARFTGGDDRGKIERRGAVRRAAHPTLKGNSMLKARTAAALFLVAASHAASAETAGIQNHDVQKLFIEQPCGAVIQAIDEPKPTPEGLGNMTMAFGFLMGFEAAHPGIKGDQETILKRLRADCAQGSTATAFDLLNGYAKP